VNLAGEAPKKAVCAGRKRGNAPSQERKQNLYVLQINIPRSVIFNH
jgi:hypothetical protein